MGKIIMRIKLAPNDPTKIRRGHQAHLSGSGTHGDRRMKRVKTRAAATRAAIDY